ncbi:protein kinase [Streptomyces sp. Ac-502]
MDDGRLVAGRYRLVEEIGRGGMGTVWRAHDELLGRQVAVKRLHVSPELDADELARRNERTRREAQAAARINHPNVVSVHDVVDDAGLPCIVMEYVPSVTLGDVIKEAMLSNSAVPPGEAARIGRGMITALRAAHSAGVLHRDVKPGNVLLGEDGRVVLTDFGIAVATGTSTLTKTGELVGSIDYLAPERVRGHTPGPAADLWALGATLYQALEGRPPFRKLTAVETAYAIAVDPLDPPRNAGPLTALIEALLAKEPADRPSAEAVEQALRTPTAYTDTAWMRMSGTSGVSGTPGMSGTSNGNPGARAAAGEGDTAGDGGTAATGGMASPVQDPRSATGPSSAVPHLGPAPQPAPNNPYAAPVPGPAQTPPSGAYLASPAADGTAATGSMATTGGAAAGVPVEGPTSPVHRTSADPAVPGSGKKRKRGRTLLLSAVAVVAVLVVAGGTLYALGFGPGGKDAQASDGGTPRTEAPSPAPSKPSAKPTPGPCPPATTGSRTRRPTSPSRCPTAGRASGRRTATAPPTSTRTSWWGCASRSSTSRARIRSSTGRTTSATPSARASSPGTSSCGCRARSSASGPPRCGSGDGRGASGTSAPWTWGSAGPARRSTRSTSPRRTPSGSGTRRSSTTSWPGSSCPRTPSSRRGQAGYGVPCHRPPVSKAPAHPHPKSRTVRGAVRVHPDAPQPSRV